MTKDEFRRGDACGSVFLRVDYTLGKWSFEVPYVWLLRIKDKITNVFLNLSI
jgi:hypothetical protein